MWYPLSTCSYLKVDASNQRKLCKHISTKSNIRVYKQKWENIEGKYLTYSFCSSDDANEDKGQRFCEDIGQNNFLFIQRIYPPEMIFTVHVLFLHVW